MSGVEGKKALVIGASRGIGAATARALAAAGADVAVAARDRVGLEKTAQSIAGARGRATTVPLDLADTDAIRPAIDAVARQLGGLSILINCAALTGTSAALNISPEEWDAVFAVNLKGLFFCCQAAACQMIVAGNGGRIVSIASVASRAAIAGRAAYGASKGGLSALTRQLAVEWAPHGITVNAVAPGWTQTDLTKARFEDDRWVAATLRKIPASRFAQPEDVAAMIVFLASDEAAYVTGQTVYVDGGLTIDATTRPED